MAEPNLTAHAVPTTTYLINLSIFGWDPTLVPGPIESRLQFGALPEIRRYQPIIHGRLVCTACEIFRFLDSSPLVPCIECLSMLGQNRASGLDTDTGSADWQSATYPADTLITYLRTF
jgi:hypothetical protein